MSKNIQHDWKTCHEGVVILPLHLGIIIVRGNNWFDLLKKHVATWQAG